MKAIWKRKGLRDQQEAEDQRPESRASSSGRSSPMSSVSNKDDNEPVKISLSTHVVNKHKKSTPRKIPVPSPTSPEPGTSELKRRLTNSSAEDMVEVDIDDLDEERNLEIDEDISQEEINARESIKIKFTTRDETREDNVEGDFFNNKLQKVLHLANFITILVENCNVSLEIAHPVLHFPVLVEPRGGRVMSAVTIAHTPAESHKNDQISYIFHLLTVLNMHASLPIRVCFGENMDVQMLMMLPGAGECTISLTDRRHDFLP